MDGWVTLMDGWVGDTHGWVGDTHGWVDEEIGEKELGMSLIVITDMYLIFPSLLKCSLFTVKPP